MSEIHKISLNFHHQLLKFGAKGLKQAANIRYKTAYLRHTIQEILANKTDMNKFLVSLYDEKYYLTDWDKIRELIENDFIDYMIYEYDYRDCDNFAFLFAARAGMYYDLNSIGVATGALYDADTNEFITRHAFNLIFTKDLDGLNVYCFEPQTDQHTKIIKGQPIILGGYFGIPRWEYRPDWLTMF